MGYFANGELAPSPVAPATGRSYRFSARRQVPAYRRQAAGLSGKINIVKLTHYLLAQLFAPAGSICYAFRGVIAFLFRRAR